ncbi:MAG TPA: hypothetical protein VF737_10645 [Gemmatimonadaceae bacterium]
MIRSEAHERFIVDVAEQLAGHEIIEGHFFSPRRVSGVERGVAVIAARPPEPPAAEPPAEPAAEREAPERYTVYTATYRHTLKGPDRGKWEVSVKAEADAPLVTVDQVVRGVQHRAEDTDEVARMTGEEIRAVADARQPAAG